MSINRIRLKVWHIWELLVYNITFHKCYVCHECKKVHRFTTGNGIEVDYNTFVDYDCFVRVMRAAHDALYNSCI